MQSTLGAMTAAAWTYNISQRLHLYALPAATTDAESVAVDAVD
jgi:hypothetical protein